jgi:site-specific DNA recombinase
MSKVDACETSNGIKTPTRSYLDEGIHLLGLVQSARRLFNRQEARDKRRLLEFVVSNCSWRVGELAVQLRQPFDILSKATAARVMAERALHADPSESVIWLGDLDSNQGCPGQSREFYR